MRPPIRAASALLLACLSLPALCPADSPGDRIAAARQAIVGLMPAPAPGWHEHPDAYQLRVNTIAYALGHNAASVRAVLAAVVVFWFESHFSPTVHAGTRLGDEGRAICLGQLQRLGMQPDEWRALGGTDLEATERCAVETMRRIERAARHCRNRLGTAYRPINAFVQYGTGSICKVERIASPKVRANFRARAALYDRLLRTRPPR